MGEFKDLVIDNLEYSIKNKIDVYPFPLPKFSKGTGDIKKDQYTVIAGRLGSGKTSFADYTFVLNLFMEWKEAKNLGREKEFKILYFSLNHTKQLKIQKWTSLIVFLKHNLLIDIATLNNERSKLTEDIDSLKAMLVDVESFFDNMLDLNLVEIIEGQKSPATISNIVDNFMESIGSDVDGKFVLDPDYEHGYYSVIVDSTDKILTEATGYGSLSREEVFVRMNEYALKFKNYYGISTVIVHATPAGLVRGPKDTETKYSDLGVFSQDCDKGFVMYNPYGEHNYNYMNVDIKGFVSITGINRLRFIALHRNKSGPDNIVAALGFYPENGFFIELPRIDTDDYNDVKQILYKNGE